jgi:tetrachlorobenzoquinone reductase
VRHPRTDNDGEDSFEVVCARSGVTLTVPPGRSILSVAKERGIDVFSWCIQGICGECETEVLAGLPDHRDALLTEEERHASRTMLICVSRCRRGPLVLGL